jgi:hypothetical protein
MKQKTESTHDVTFKLSQDEKEFLSALVDGGFQLSCSLVSEHWQENWQRCPLCGARVNKEGLVVHELTQ